MQTFALSETSTAVVSALSTVASDISGVVTSVAPVAIGVVGTFLVWKYGMRFFKSLAK